MTHPTDPPMFIRAHINGALYDVAIADISAIGVPAARGHGVPIIVGGLQGTMPGDQYAVVHAAWVARRRSSAGR